MPSFSDLLSRYFVQDGDPLEAGERVPATSEGNLVEPLIDGHAYFGALREEIEFLRIIAQSDPSTGNDSDPFFYVIGWLHGLVATDSAAVFVRPTFGTAWALMAYSTGVALRLEDGSSGPAPLLIDKLEEMAAAGVDVRVLGWVSPLVLNYELVAQPLQFHAFSNNIVTIESLKEVRKRIGPGAGTMLTMGNPLGAMHLKAVVAGTVNGIRAYVAGIDLDATRVASRAHPPDMPWHDAGVRIQGPAADTVYAVYRDVWNEQIDRPPDRFYLNGTVVQSHYTTTSRSIEPPGITAPVSERHSPAPNAQGPQHVQVLRTLPRIALSPGRLSTFSRELLEKLAIVGSGRQAFSFAPDGVFEFRAALHKAIMAAERYIYIEDQSFSAIEVMEWINERLRNVPALNAILVWGPDTGDPPEPSLFHEAISHLIAGVSDVANRVYVFRREALIVHTKITIIDDVWAVIGSANCKRRSLYTDGELSVSVMEDSATPFAQRLRRDLWWELCGLPLGGGRESLMDLDFAMTVVEEAATRVGPPPSGGTHFAANVVRLRLPLEYASSPAPGQLPGSPPVFDPSYYDLHDWDSR